MTAQKPAARARGSKSAQIREPVLLTLGQLAAEFSMSRDVLRRIVSEAGVAPAGKRSGHPIYRLRDVFQAVQAQHEPEAMSPHARLALARAIKTEDEIRLRRGELIEVHDHQRRVAQLAMIVSRSFDVAVDSLERDVGLSSTQAEYLEAYFDKCRIALHAEWVRE